MEFIQYKQSFEAMNYDNKSAVIMETDNVVSLNLLSLIILIKLRFFVGFSICHYLLNNDCN